MKRGRASILASVRRELDVLISSIPNSVPIHRAGQTLPMSPPEMLEFLNATNKKISGAVFQAAQSAPLSSVARTIDRTFSHLPPEFPRSKYELILSSRFTFRGFGTIWLAPLLSFIKTPSEGAYEECTATPKHQPCRPACQACKGWGSKIAIVAMRDIFPPVLMANEPVLQDVRKSVPTHPEIDEMERAINKALDQWCAAKSILPVAKLMAPFLIRLGLAKSNFMLECRGLLQQADQTAPQQVSAFRSIMLGYPLYIERNGELEGFLSLSEAAEKDGRQPVEKDFESRSDAPCELCHGKGWE